MYDFVQINWFIFLIFSGRMRPIYLQGMRTHILKHHFFSEEIFLEIYTKGKIEVKTKKKNWRLSDVKLSGDCGFDFFFFFLSAMYQLRYGCFINIKKLISTFNFFFSPNSGTINFFRGKMHRCWDCKILQKKVSKPGAPIQVFVGCGKIFSYWKFLDTNPLWENQSLEHFFWYSLCPKSFLDRIFYLKISVLGKQIFFFVEIFCWRIFWWWFFPCGKNSDDFLESNFFLNNFLRSDF